jgi:hypothetical protein
LHVIQDLADLLVGTKIVATLLDEISREFCASSVISSVTHIALPESEHFTHKVVFEEPHTCEDVEHGALTHPLVELVKFGWDGLLVCFSL